MSNVQVTVSVPAESQALALAVKTLVLAIVANAKAGGGVIVEVSADVTAAVGAVVPALAGIGALGTELSTDPIGLAEAFVLAGVETAKTLAKSPSAS